MADMRQSTERYGMDWWLADCRMRAGVEIYASTCLAEFSHRRHLKTVHWYELISWEVYQSIVL